MRFPPERSARLNLSIIGIGLRPLESGIGFDLWVKTNGPIKKPEDLLGKQVALYSLRSVLAAVIYTSLGDIMKLDLKQIEFVEMPPPAMPAALATGRVAAASLIQAQVYQATKSGEYKLLIPAGTVFKQAKEFNCRSLSSPPIQKSSSRIQGSIRNSFAF